MVQVDIPIAFAIGQIFADAAQKQLLTRRPEYYLSALVKNNLFHIFFFSWIPVYFLVNYFGWETTHMWWHKGSITDYPFFLPIFLLVFFFSTKQWFLYCYIPDKKDKMKHGLVLPCVIRSFFVFSVNKLGVTPSSWLQGFTG